MAICTAWSTTAERKKKKYKSILFSPYQVDPDSRVTQGSVTTIAACTATLNQADRFLSNEINSSLWLGLIFQSPVRR